MELSIPKVKKILIFSEMEFFNFMFFLYFGNFLVSSLKQFLYFRIWNFLAARLETFVYFRRELSKPEKQTKKSAPKKFPVFLLHKIKNSYSRMMKVVFLLHYIKNGHKTL